MKAILSPTSIADFCQALIAKKIVVNRDYQRDDRIWSPYIRSYFIESILLEFPIPKIFLFVRYDLRTRTSIKEIVDGQQRSQALRAFYENRMRLSTRIETQEFQGKRYKDLDEEFQGKFLSYSLAIDEFSGVSEDEIRESFARMNVHNVTLNSEELRNAKYQGEFKIFILMLAKAFREPLIQVGLLSRRDVVRMADTRMIAEAAYIMDRGIRTTRPPEIDALYSSYEKEFPDQEAYASHMRRAFEFWYNSQLFEFEELNRKHIFYTFLAAIMELQNPGLISGKLTAVQNTIVAEIIASDATLAELNRDILISKSDEFTGEVADLSFGKFVEACATKTNVEDQKLIRYAYILSAIARL
ncbi:MAG: DUF262 domain-containing protein [Aurantimonas endophytica]|uniref:DUF262 domain-containing protein n=1 Tax=Aurantimonas endophytica TaxID=1522175 RepID=UPI00300394C7